MENILFFLIIQCREIFIGLQSSWLLPLPWTRSLARSQPVFNSALSAACTAFNFHFLLEPKLNWVPVSALAMGGVLQKAKAGASKQLPQRAGGVWGEPGRGARGERSPCLSPSASSATLTCLQLWGLCK